MSYRDSVRSEGRRPSCYGDPDVYDLRDRDCKECPFKATCRVAVNKKLRRQEDNDEPRHKSKSKSARRHGRRVGSEPDPESYIERDDESLGFFGALAVNGALSGVRAMFVEATFAVDQIPRYPYPDPFKPAIKRGRQAAGVDDDDDDEDGYDPEDE